MPGRTIHTERLDLVPWDASHATALAQLARSSAAALPQLLRNPLWNPDHPEVVALELARQWEEHGFGWRAITERVVGEIVGFVGVSYLGSNELGLSPSDFEFGCWVHPAHLRRGVAIEASLAVIDEAFDELGAPSVMGCARVDHRASLNGAAALGFRVDEERAAGASSDVVVLRVTADEWAATRLAATQD